MTIWRIAFASLLACSALLWANPTPTARAHASLVQAVPPAGAVLGTAPARVDLLFSEELDHEDSRLRVYDAAGNRVDRGDLQVIERRMTIGVRDVAPGTYRVQWTAVSEDDQGRTTGGYMFQVGAAAPGAPRLTISPASTNAGQTITLTGAGFSPSSVALVTFGSDQQLLQPVTTDAQGGFSFQTLVPLSLAYGRHVYQALDLDLRMAAAALWLERGGWPPLTVQVTATREDGHGHGHGHGHGAAPAAAAPGAMTGHENHVEVAVRLVNQSNFNLRRVRVAATIPPGMRLLREGLEGPDGTRWSVQDGQLVWTGGRVGPHQIGGPYSFTLDAGDLPANVDPPVPLVTVTFETTEPPLSGTATNQPPPAPAAPATGGPSAGAPSMGTAAPAGQPAVAPGGSASGTTPAPSAPATTPATPQPTPGTRPAQP